MNRLREEVFARVEAAQGKGARVMRHDLRDAVLNYLFTLMEFHMARGHTYDEAIMLGIGEIRRQIHGTRRDLANSLVDEAVGHMRAWNQAEARWP